MVADNALGLHPRALSATTSGIFSVYTSYPGYNLYINTARDTYTAEYKHRAIIPRGNTARYTVRYYKHRMLRGHGRMLGCQYVSKLINEKEARRNITVSCQSNGGREGQRKCRRRSDVGPSLSATIIYIGKLGGLAPARPIVSHA